MLGVTSGVAGAPGAQAISGKGGAFGVAAVFQSREGPGTASMLWLVGLEEVCRTVDRTAGELGTDEDGTGVGGRCCDMADGGGTVFVDPKVA